MVAKSKFFEPVFTIDKRNPIKRGIINLYDWLLSHVPAVNEYGAIVTGAADVVTDDDASLRRDAIVLNETSTATNVTLNSSTWTTIWDTNPMGYPDPLGYVKPGYAIHGSFDVTVISTTGGCTVEFLVKHQNPAGALDWNYGRKLILAGSGSYQRTRIPFFYYNSTGSDMIIDLILYGRGYPSSTGTVYIYRNTSYNYYTPFLWIRDLGNDTTWLTDYRGVT